MILSECCRHFLSLERSLSYSKVIEYSMLFNLSKNFNITPVISITFTRLWKINATKLQRCFSFTQDEQRYILLKGIQCSRNSFEYVQLWSQSPIQSKCDGVIPSQPASSSWKQLQLQISKTVLPELLKMKFILPQPLLLPYLCRFVAQFDKAEFKSIISVIFI